MDFLGTEIYRNQKLLELCQKFIKDNQIGCAETIGQSDRVIVNAYDFLEEMCELVGYHVEVDE